MSVQENIRILTCGDCEHLLQRNRLISNDECRDGAIIWNLTVTLFLLLSFWCNVLNSKHTLTGKLERFASMILIWCFTDSTVSPTTSSPGTWPPEIDFSSVFYSDEVYCCLHTSSSSRVSVTLSSAVPPGFHKTPPHIENSETGKISYKGFNTETQNNFLFFWCVDFCVFSANIPWEWLRFFSDCEINEQNSATIWNSTGIIQYYLHFFCLFVSCFFFLYRDKHNH